MLYKKIVLLVFMTIYSLEASSIDKMLSDVNNANKDSISSQKKVNKYANESEKIFDEYSRLSKELDEQNSYNKQIELFIQTQNNEIPKLKNQLKEITQTHKRIIPLMLDMLSTLDKFIEIDTPFLYEERLLRINNLKTYLANSDISISEQYRMIMDSYKIEYSYARSIEVYRDKLSNEDTRSVDFLRIGRAAFYYQSLNLQESGLYDFQNKKWIILDKKYNQDISKAIRMARKKIAPDFLTLPILSAKASK